MKTIFPVVLLASALLLTACGVSISPQSADGQEGAPVKVITATLPPTNTPWPTATPIPATPTATIQPFNGVVTTRVNVRLEPGTTAETLGRLNINETVTIMGQNSAKTWYRIEYTDSPNGFGWISAQFVRVSGNRANIPVIDAPNSTATPTPAQSGSANPTGTLTEQINVRSGPSTTFDSLGILSKGQTVTLTGQNADKTWLRIEYTDSPDGFAWVSAQFVQTDAADLPVIDEAGNIAGTATPTGIPATPAATVIPAPQDADSASNPGAKVTLSNSGIRSFQYSEVISAPQGDVNDWVEFSVLSSLPSVNVYVNIACTPNTPLEVTFWQAGMQIPAPKSLNCDNKNTALLVNTGKPYQLKLTALATTGNLTRSAYTLQIRLKP